MNDDYETRKVLLKQGEYRKLYSSLLQKHKGILQEETCGKQNDDFRDESNILNQIFQTEVKNLALGVGATAVTLASLRFVRSRYAVSTVFGPSKAKALHEAEIEGKRVGTDTFQKTFATTVEGLFSLWMGFRCYDYASHQSNDSMNAISELPLCKGRSRVSEALCPEWIEITNNNIPDSFWNALSKNNIQEKRTWTAIQMFSQNCERRLSEERRIRNEQSLPEEEPVVIAQRLVPTDESAR